MELFLHLYKLCTNKARGGGGGGGTFALSFQYSPSLLDVSVHCFLGEMFVFSANYSFYPRSPVLVVLAPTLICIKLMGLQTSMQ